MARGIITCTGETINVGDVVQTASGEVIRVEGAAIGKSFHNAEKCKLMPHGTKTTAEKHAATLASANADAAKRGEDSVKPVGGAASDTGDCIVWGS